MTNFPFSAVGGLLGSLYGTSKEEDIARDQMQFQKKQAKRGIRWLARDAKRAGIHPLAALGAGRAGYSPVSFQSDMGQAGAELGDAISGVVNMRQNKQERELDKRYKEAQVVNLELENMRSRTLLNQAKTGAQGSNSYGTAASPGETTNGIDRNIEGFIVPIPVDSVRMSPDELLTHMLNKGTFNNDAHALLSANSGLYRWFNTHLWQKSLKGYKQQEQAAAEVRRLFGLGKQQAAGIIQYMMAMQDAERQARENRKKQIIPRGDVRFPDTSPRS